MLQQRIYKKYLHCQKESDYKNDDYKKIIICLKKTPDSLDTHSLLVLAIKTGFV